MLYQQDFQRDVDSKILPVDIAERVMYYAQWLARDASKNTGDLKLQASTYTNEAMQTVKVAGIEVRTFAPFRHGFSALQTMTGRQKLILRLLGLAYVGGLIFYSVLGLQIIIAVLTSFYIVDLLVYFFLSIRMVAQPAEEQIDDALVGVLADAPWPRYTILCPLYKEAEVVPQFAQAMQALDYPTDKLQILFLTEDDDNVTRNAIKTLHLPPHFEIVTVPDGQPRTKPRACNYGLLQATGDYVVIYDAEDVPDPLQLKKAVLTFANHNSEVACVQAKLNFYNAEQNMLTRWFTAEYSSWFDMTLPGLQSLGIPLPLGGTSNHFRTELLRQVGAWDPFNVTEDCDLGLRLSHFRLKTVVIDSTTYEEANSQLKNWIRQRSRWIKGYMQTYLVYMRRPLDYLRPGGLRDFLSLQFVIGGKTGVLLVNPLMWMLVALYLLFQSSVTPAYHVLYPAPVLYMASLCLIFGNFMYAYIHLVGCMKRGHYSIIKWALLMPIYWALGSAAAYMALYQLVFKPHYWEKTLHGLHLRKQAQTPHVTSIHEASSSTEEVELLTTSISSSISLTAEDYELEVVEKTVRWKVQSTGKLPAIPKQRALESKHDTGSRGVAVLDAPEDEVTELRLPAITKPLLEDASNKLIGSLSVGSPPLRGPAVGEDAFCPDDGPPQGGRPYEGRDEQPQAEELDEITQEQPAIKKPLHSEEGEV
ncbi:MAG TPA: glycosyltransferase [Ktedonosporobacter sp.]|nr:glycosyltransferase [Ktedonosporobacter sp.]